LQDYRIAEGRLDPSCNSAILQFCNLSEGHDVELLVMEPDVRLDRHVAAD
jgi:hypothetical protein